MCVHFDFQHGNKKLKGSSQEEKVGTTASAGSFRPDDVTDQSFE